MQTATQNSTEKSWLEEARATRAQHVHSAADLAQFEADFPTRPEAIQEPRTFFVVVLRSGSANRVLHFGNDLELAQKAFDKRVPALRHGELQLVRLVGHVSAVEMLIGAGDRRRQRK